MNQNEMKDILVDYDSPIDAIFQSTIDNMASAFSKSIDDGVMTAVVNAGFNISKEKLEQVLSQDKCRYEEAYRRGYAAGYAKRDAEIIRCGKCRFNVKSKKGDGYCCGTCDELGYVDDDWFCADGKPKDGEAD